MGRGRFFIAVLIALGLALPPIGSAAYADTSTEVECGFTSEVRTDGFDASTAVASYVVRATWCIETTYETRTITEQPSSEELSASDDAKAAKAKKAKGKKGKKARRRAKRRAKDRSSSAPTTRTERRIVKTCMTDFHLDAVPSTLVDGAGLIGVTTSETSGNACAGRSYHVVGRFGREYVPGMEFLERSVVSQTVAGVTTQNYPLGRLGHFDFTVSFPRDGGAICDRCVPNFKFCDVRIVYGNDASCLHL
jgi:hypothetical protein